MFGMRLVHAGLVVHFVSDCTTPAFDRGDTLIVASASGRTESVLHVARGAREFGGLVIAISGRATSPLIERADEVVIIPAASKGAEDKTSAQFAGSLFEQVLLLLADVLFENLLKRTGQKSPDDLITSLQSRVMSDAVTTTNTMYETTCRSRSSHTGKGDSHGA
jgi:6-phospho-3-hexuloisomerase